MDSSKRGLADVSSETSEEMSAVSNRNLEDSLILQPKAIVSVLPQRQNMCIFWAFINNKYINVDYSLNWFLL